ncbi:hypothetical protein SAMN05444266_102301 [Chitinophaga jiangningensis]|uniref:Uncharacterized protein n=1 Tax=Chitinophaga jiangningensis TaxID=1419482 RepID=A0A1M6YG18_9BACT|nr:hypothetical protein [Chitinophaga jiangningensis]SHL17207.1 hypothetical protein SAMN05444266_102301 [Chitinophaga jiangningensis]
MKKKRKQKLLLDTFKVRRTRKDYSNDDFFVKKLELAKESLTKWGLPPES